MNRSPNLKPFFFAGLLLTAIVCSSCTFGTDITGRWQEVGAQATLVFREDGTFSAVDNQGMQVGGVYRVEGDGKIRFDIRHADGSIETVYGKVDRQGDGLSLTADDGGEVERYRRVTLPDS